MRFIQTTTTQDLLKEFKESAFGLLDDIGTMYENGKKVGFEENILAVRARKLILAWYARNGGL